VLVLGALAAPATSATITVNTNGDEITLNGVCSLREAIRNANSDSAPTTDCPPGSGVDTILVPSGLFIKLTKTGAPDDNAFAGDLDITGPVTIAGAGPLTTVVNGNGTDRVFDIASGVEPVRISGLRIENGRVLDAGGGGIRSGGTLEVVNSLVTGNTVDSLTLTVHGGGIQNLGGILTVSKSSVSGNSVLAGSGAGGGIAQTNGRTVTVVNSTISGNRAGGVGGGIYDVEGSGVSVQGSTVTGNEADTQGGGFYLFGLSVTAYSLSNTTIADNKAGTGGGIWLNAKAATTLTRLNVLRNQATGGRGGGIRLEQNGSGLVQVRESRISGNTASQGGGGMATQGSGAGDIRVEKTTIDGNNAAEGDGISNSYLGDDLHIVNSTISGNGLSSTAGNGGGLHTANATSTTLANVTLNANAAGVIFSGGNIYGIGGITAKNTIVANPGAGGNCGGTDPAPLGTNLDWLPGGGGTECFTRSGDPMLGPLANNGGPTMTHSIAGAMAINDGAGCEAIDQRGAPRSLGGACDLGAYERITCAGGLVNRVGTNSADRMTGSNASEVFLMLGGNDVLTPGRGTDRACMGTGNDTVRARDGKRDFLRGEGGSRDRLATRDSVDSFTGFERLG
jgi:CSLREA domain-containing protein